MIVNVNEAKGKIVLKQILGKYMVRQTVDLLRSDKNC